ncbi:MAG: glycosyltransferase family 2 protein [Chloroflexi bacterium]|nr:glycosyltransferase family 2 protein [Chloroflexota bacterium]
MIQNQTFIGVNLTDAMDAVIVQSGVVPQIITKSPYKPKIIAGIPAYNEEQFISEIVRKTSRFVDEVIVVDDGSTDRTVQVAEAAGATVIRHKVNRGAGAATETCFKEARKRGADVLVTLDGDGQHNPDEINDVAGPALSGEADLVIGSRFIENHNNMPIYRRLGINVITWLCNFGSKERITDTQCCFRAYGKKAIHTLGSNEEGFGFSIDLLIQSRDKDLNIAEVPISCIYHSDCHTENPVTHGLGVAYSVLKFRLKSRWNALTNTPSKKPDAIVSESDVRPMNGSPALADRTAMPN